MGCRRIRFLQAQEGYYCTFSLINNTHTINSFNIHLTNFTVYITYSYFLNPYQEFIAKLIFSDLSYFNIHLLIKFIKHNRKKINKTTTTQDIRGSPLVQGLCPQNYGFIKLFTNNPVLICTLSCRDCPCTQLGLNLRPKIGLSFFTSNYHHTKTFKKSLFSFT